MILISKHYFGGDDLVLKSKKYFQIFGSFEIFESTFNGFFSSNKVLKLTSAVWLKVSLRLRSHVFCIPYLCVPIQMLPVLTLLPKSHQSLQRHRQSVRSLHSHLLHIVRYRPESIILSWINKSLWWGI